jgi:hypothetical protein
LKDYKCRMPKWIMVISRKPRLGLMLGTMPPWWRKWRLCQQQQQQSKSASHPDKLPRGAGDPTSTGDSKIAALDYSNHHSRDHFGALGTAREPHWVLGTECVIDADDVHPCRALPTT